MSEQMLAEDEWEAEHDAIICDEARIWVELAHLLIISFYSCEEESDDG